MNQSSVPRVSFEDHHLENGLRVIFQHNSRTPLIHISLHYCVGSSYETRGRSGFAHLFEHMMFQGSDNVAKNEHGRRVDEAGGLWNASTSKDRTMYYNTLPAHFLELGLWLEADRMRSLKVTEENFENQRQTVIEEKKQSYDNRPYGSAYLRFDELAYLNWAYAHSIIGTEEDLLQATIEEVQDFHRAFYGPGNAILVISGDFDPVEVLSTVRRHFGDIPDETNATQPELSEPAQAEEKLEVIEDPLAVLPAAIIGYHTPELGSKDYFVLSMLALALADGDSSRIYRKLVYENNWISGLFAGPNQYKGPEIFRAWFQIQSGVPVQSVLDAFDDEIDRLSNECITREELEKARNQVSHRFVGQLSTVSQVGELLAHSASHFGTPEMVNQQLSHFMSVTPEEIMEATRKYFTRENRTTILVEPRNNA